MSELIKPSERPKWAVGLAADVQTPPDPKQEIGFIVEIPPFQWFNWFQKFNYQWLKFLEEKTDRAPGGAPISELTIAAGAIAPTFGVHFVAAESGVSDDVSTIAVDELNDGSILLLTPSAGHTIRFIHSANLVLRGASNLTLPPDQYVVFHRRGSVWYEVLNFSQNEIDARNPGDDLNIGADRAAEINLGKAGVVTNANDLDTRGAAETMNIGATRASIINIGRAGATVNIFGAVAYLYMTELVITDRKITLNNGGSAGSGSDVGFEIQENGSATGYFKTSTDRDFFDVKVPNSADVGKLRPTTTGGCGFRGMLPLGAVIATMPHLTGAYSCAATTAADDAGFVLCNGQTIADATSPMNGQVIPQINNDVFLMGTAGATTSAAQSANTKTLAVANIPQLSGTFTSGNQSADHTHTWGNWSGGQNSNHTHTVNAANIASPQYASINSGNLWIGTATHTTSGYSADHAHYTSGTTSGMSVSHTHSTTVTLGTASPTAIDVRPKYITAKFIMRIK